MEVENTHFCDPLYANKYVDDAPLEVSPSSSSASSTTLTFLMCLECFCCGTFDFCWAHVVFTFLRFCKYLKKIKNWPVQAGLGSCCVCLIAFDAFSN